MVDLDRTLRARARDHHLAQRLRGLPAPGDRRCRCCGAMQPTAALPAAGLSRRRPGESLFLPAAGAPERTAREEVLDDLIEALALGVRDYFEKIGRLQARWASRSPAGATRMLTLLIAWRAACLLARSRRERSAGRADPGLLHADPLLGGGDARRRGDARAGAGRRPAGGADRGGLRPRGGATREMLGGGEPTEITRQNIQARLRAGRMWNWANSSGGAVPPDRRHEREGGGLHHHRRRPRGRAVGDRQRAEDGGGGPARAVARAASASRASARRWRPSRPGAGRRAGRRRRS